MYGEPVTDGTKENVAQFELPLWLLGQCATVKEVRALLAKIQITNTPFNEKYPVSQLHWMIADREETIVVEAVADGLHIYDNPAGVLTNNPPFPQQMFRLNDYRGLSPRQPENTFAPGLDLTAYSRGMGASGCRAIYLLGIPLYTGCLCPCKFFIERL